MLPAASCCYFSSCFVSFILFLVFGFVLFLSPFFSIFISDLLFVRSFVAVCAPYLEIFPDETSPPNINMATNVCDTSAFHAVDKRKIYFCSLHTPVFTWN